jgi:hypothetical protein
MLGIDRGRRMTIAISRREPIRLNYRDGQVMVTPEDQDIFFISAEKATAACRDAVKDDERIAAFKARFLVPLHDWCGQHSDRVAACYLPVPAGYLHAFIVTKSPRFDFDLAEEIAAVERELAKAGWRVGVSQLPAAEDRSLETFFDPDGALEIYADRGPASE